MNKKTREIFLITISSVIFFISLILLSPQDITMDGAYYSYLSINSALKDTIPFPYHLLFHIFEKFLAMKLYIPYKIMPFTIIKLMNSFALIIDTLLLYRLSTSIGVNKKISLITSLIFPLSFTPWMLGMDGGVYLLALIPFISGFLLILPNKNEKMKNIILGSLLTSLSILLHLISTVGVILLGIFIFIRCFKNKQLISKLLIFLTINAIVCASVYSFIAKSIANIDSIHKFLKWIGTYNINWAPAGINKIILPAIGFNRFFFNGTLLTNLFYNSPFTFFNITSGIFFILTALFILLILVIMIVNYKKSLSFGKGIIIFLTTASIIYFFYNSIWVPQYSPYHTFTMVFLIPLLSIIISKSNSGLLYKIIITFILFITVINLSFEITPRSKFFKESPLQWTEDEALIKLGISDKDAIICFDFVKFPLFYYTNGKSNPKEVLIRGEQMSIGNTDEINEKFTIFENMLKEIWKNNGKIYISGTIVDVKPFRFDIYKSSPYSSGQLIRKYLGSHLKETSMNFIYRGSIYKMYYIEEFDISNIK